MSTDQSDDVERQILEKARTEFNEWLNAKIAWPPPVPNRKAFNRLEGACRQLITALQPFNGATTDQGLLLCAALQDNFCMLPKGDHTAALDDLGDLLDALASAASVHGGRGVEANAHVLAWVWIAADHWKKETGKSPSAAARARFWGALQNLQSSQSTSSTRMPQLTQDIVKTALRDWHRRNP